MNKIVHLVDDQTMGGVMIALMNFQDPRITKHSENHTVIVNPINVKPPKINSDIIIIHFTVSWRKLPFLIGLRMRNPGVRIIIIEHSYTAAFEEWNVPSVLRFRQMLRASYACVDEVVAISHKQREWLSSLVGKGKITTIPQSRILDCFASVKPKSRMAGEPITFGAIGRLHQQKGIDDLIKAFRHPALASARLLIAGEGAMDNELRHFAGGATNIEFLGSTDDPAAFYESVDCVIIPSRWEAFGLVASEAMAAGRFVIANDIDGLSEQVSHCGMLVKAGDTKELGYALLKASRMTPARMGQLGEAGRLIALGRYDAMIENWRNHLFASESNERASRNAFANSPSPMPTMIRPGQ